MPEHDLPPDPVAAVLLRALAAARTSSVSPTTPAAWCGSTRPGGDASGVGPEERLSTADLFGAEVFERYYQEIRPALLSQGRWTGVVPVRSAPGARPRSR
jgi:hypothetical protein